MATRSRGRSYLQVVVGLSLVFAVAACSGGSGTTERTTPHTATPSTATTEPHKKSDAGGDSGGGSRPTVTMPSSGGVQVTADIGPAEFTSPTGNIGCILDATSGARCDIMNRDWSPPPPPPSCQLDYGQGLTVDSDGATFVCAGDTAFVSSNVLAYGDIAQRGSFRCDSQESGMTCVDLRTAHGFFLSVQAFSFS